MKKLTLVLISIILLVVLGLLLWPRSRNSGGSVTGYSTTMQLTGTQGAAFTGEYLQAGKRVTFSGVLPWSSTVSNISRLEIRKAKPEDSLVFAAQGGGSALTVPCGPGSQGLRVEMAGGWSVETIR
jgi:hypothetical protein